MPSGHSMANTKRPPARPAAPFRGLKTIKDGLLQSSENAAIDWGRQIAERDAEIRRKLDLLLEE